MNGVAQYDGDTGAYIRHLGSDSEGVYSIARAPDNTVLVADQFAKRVVQYDPITGQVLKQFDKLADVLLVFGVAAAPNRDVLLSAYTPGANVHRFDLDSGHHKGTFMEFLSPSRMSYSPDGDLFVSFGRGKSISVYDGISGDFKRLFTAGDELQDAGQVCFGPDAYVYVPDVGTSFVHRYDYATGTYLGVFASVEGYARAATFGPNGNLYVAGDAAVREYDGHTGQHIRTIPVYGIEQTSIVFAQVPEPATVVTIVVGVAGLVRLRRKS